MRNNSEENSFALFAMSSLGPTSSQIICYPVILYCRSRRRCGNTHIQDRYCIPFSVNDKFYTVSRLEKKHFFDLNQTKFLSVVDECRVLCILFLLSSVVVVVYFVWHFPFRPSHIIEFQGRIHTQIEKKIILNCLDA